MYNKLGHYKDPIVKYQPEVKEVKLDFLNAGELEVMANKKLVSDWVSQVRDIFRFSCYTGLADADAKKFPRAMELMAKYEDNPQCVNDGLLLPVLSNRKMNRYLKEIGDACGTRSRWSKETYFCRHNSQPTRIESWL